LNKHIKIKIEMNYYINSMEQSPSSKVTSLSATQEIPPPFMDLETSLTCSQEYVAGHFSEPI
jgi:hypothetical protein